MSKVDPRGGDIGTRRLDELPADVTTGVPRGAPTQPRTTRRLKRGLQVLDLLGFGLGWVFAFVLATAVSGAPSSARPLVGLGALGIVTALMVVASKRLWLARVCAMRSAQIEGVGHAAILSALVVLAAGAVLDYDAPDSFAVMGAAFSFVAVTAFRLAYEASLRRARRRGRLARRLVLVGTNEQSFELAHLINRHPELGFEIVGVCGSRSECFDRMSGGLRWLGSHENAASAVAETDATGVLVVGSAFASAELNVILRELLRSGGCHVHLSSGLSGISHDRLVPLPMAYEPLFYVEGTSLTTSQLAIKRTMDIVLGAALVVLTLPVIVVAVVAVKLDDGGPAFFRQRRVGRHDRPFTMYKLRTMVADAEERRAALEDSNLRNGPLFKLARDPRITRVGRILRASSIDELPQLFNVMRGDMSLVGPRPALPHEVAEFDEELQQRGRMMPGITGLWQVEARDDPSFASYRRLDLFYVENWSIGLDLAILFATTAAVVPRGLRGIVSSSGPA